jgi:hypothetical protein
MLKIIQLLLLAVSTSTLVSFSAFGQKESCKEQLNDLLYNLSSKAQGSHARYLEYTTTNYLRAPITGGPGAISSKTKLYSHGERLHYITDDIEVYKDGLEMMLVLKEKQAVFLADAELANGQYEQMHLMKQKVLENLLDLQCQKIGNETSITLLPGDSLGLEVEKLIYVLEPSYKQIKRIEVYYKAEHPLEKTELNFIKVDDKAEAALLPVNVKALLYDTEGKLKPAYKSYKIMDRRKKARKGINK